MTFVPLRRMLNCGAAPGSTMTLNVQKFVLPAVSRAVCVTMFVPIGKTEPDAGLVVVRERRQTLFFSATIPPEISEIASFALRNPARVEIGVSRTVNCPHIERVRRAGKTG